MTNYGAEYIECLGRYDEQLYGSRSTKLVPCVCNSLVDLLQRSTEETRRTPDSEARHGKIELMLSHEAYSSFTERVTRCTDVETRRCIPSVSLWDDLVLRRDGERTSLQRRAVVHSNVFNQHHSSENTTNKLNRK